MPTQVDLKRPAPGMPFEFKRYYNSRMDFWGPWGWNWGHTYSVNVVSRTTDEIHFGMPWSNWVNFKKDETTGDWGPMQPPAQRYTLTEDSGDGSLTLGHNKRSYHYDENDVLLEIQDDKGNSVNLSYDTTGLLIEIEDTAGRTYSLDWEPTTPPAGSDNYGPPLTWTLTTLTEDATGRVITYNRDSSDALLEVTDSANPTGSGVLYTYSSSPDAYTLVSISNQRGNDVIEVEYDGQDRVTRYEENGQSIEYDYSVTGTIYKDFPDDSQERVTLTTWGHYETFLDSYGNEKFYEYDSDGFLTEIIYEDASGDETIETYETGCTCSGAQLLSLEEPNGVSWTYEYDEDGNRTSMVDPLGNETTYEYDTDGNQTAIEDPLGNRTTFTYNAAGQVLTKTDASDYVTSYTYDASGNLTQMVEPEGATSTYTYDGVGDRITYTDPNGNEWEYGYDSAGRLLVTTNPLGHEISYEYDADSNRTQISDPIGAVTTQVFDDFNRLTEVQRPDTAVRHLSYTTNGDLISDTEQPMFTHIYDGHHRKLYTLRDDGDLGAIVYSYDSEGNTTEAKDILDAVTGDPTGEDGDVTSYEFDGRNRQTKKTDAEGGVEEYIYDGAGRLMESIDADAGLTTNVYDATGRLIEVVTPLGDSMVYSYDATGNRTSVTDPLGNETTYAFDGQGRMMTTTDPLGNTTRFAYHANGNLTTLTDANNNDWLFEYDALNHVTKEEDPLGNTKSYTYDAVGRLASKVDAHGTAYYYYYDDAGRLIEVEYPNDPLMQITYDTSGNPIVISQGQWSLDYRYDTLNRRVEYELSGTHLDSQYASPRVTYSYDGRDRRTHVILTGLVEGPSSALPYEYSYVYGYDAADRLVSVDGASGTTPTTIVGLEYTAAGRRSVISRANGVTTTSEYDAMGQILSIQHTRNSDQEVLSSFQYTYDVAGRRSSRLSNDGLMLYSYDASNRLTSSTVTSETETFTMDAVGNLTSIDNDTGYRTLEYDDGDRLTSEEGASTTTYAFDANGNLTTKTAAGLIHEYFRDDRGKLVNYSQDSSTIVTYSYYPESDHLLSRHEDGDAYGAVLWSGRNALADLYRTDDDYLAVVRHYAVNTPYDDVFAVTDLTRSGHDFYLRDALLSVYQLANTTGGIASAYNYSVYGEPRDWDDTETTDNRFTFTGRDFDPATGMYYYRARWYSAAPGQFASSDPLVSLLLLRSRLSGQLARAAGMHMSRYVYAERSPGSKHDPTGHFAIALPAFALGACALTGALNKLMDTGFGLAQHKVLLEHINRLHDQIKQAKGKCPLDPRIPDWEKQIDNLSGDIGDYWKEFGSPSVPDFIGSACFTALVGWYGLPPRSPYFRAP